jgi:hypothetical protein
MITEPEDPSTPSSRSASPRPALAARPTFYPAALALGITFTLGGFITSWLMFGVGVVLFAVSLAGWIGEMRREA